MALNVLHQNGKRYIAHDFGAIGPNGTGILGQQNMLGKVDIVIGSFSKTFASSGGFVGSSYPHVKQYLKCFASPLTFSNSLSPVQAEVVRAALRIVRSPEGEFKRQQLMKCVKAIRDELKHFGISYTK